MITDQYNSFHYEIIMLPKSISRGLIKRSSSIIQFSCTFSNHAVCLQTEYPELYKLVHPSDQTRYREQMMDVTTTVTWKCPNGEDHEWEMSISEVIHLFNRNKRHSNSRIGP